jgi:hypothetical protein
MFLKNVNFIGLLEKWNDQLADIALHLHLKAVIFYIAAAVIAVLIGLAGMHLAKMLSTLGMTGFGYVLGIELFHFLKLNAPLLAKMPNWLSYVFGLAIAAFFLFLSWKRVLHVIFSLFVVVGYIFVANYVHENVLLALGGGILIALLATFMLKFMFILLTSVAGGMMLTSLLGEIWPKFSFLQLGTNKVALWVALGVALIFFLIQLATTRDYDAAN